MIRIGVDTGGTFTDLVRLDEHGLSVHKVRSTQDDPARAILSGIADLMGEISPTEIIHGSTVATNALLERKGARIALITTEGFQDLLAIGRQTRSQLYNFMVRDNRSLLDPGLIFGLTGRLDHHGSVLVPLEANELAEITKRLHQASIECVAVCLLHSYANPVHERQVAEHLAQAGFTVSASYKILPEYREYERSSTTVVNAYVTPIISRYLETLERCLGATRLHVMQSNGGSISAAQARASAVRTILSGPAAGAVGGQAAAQASGFDRAILFDMGGTSTDVTLCDRGLGSTSESSVGGFPVRLAMLDIHTVGAGGGSIAYVDSGGSLRVGPRSAGADPGPVCYGTGTELTVTDANLLLGRLDPHYFLGGRMPIDTERTAKCADAFAKKLNISPTRLAEGIVQIANANMEHAIRAVSVERGHDTRDFALLAFGGAGGMHACEIADTLEIPIVIVPRHAGVLSALGMLLADVRKDYSQTILQPSDLVTFHDLENGFAPLIDQAKTDLAGEGFAPRDVVVTCSLDVRYQGQGYEINVPFTQDSNAGFHREHQRLYGYSNSARATEVVNLRVSAVGITRKYAFPSSPAEPRPLHAAIATRPLHAAIATRPLHAAIATRPAWFQGGWQDTAIYHSEHLQPGMEGAGPGILTGGQSTVVIPPNFGFRIDGTGALIASRLDQTRLRRPAGVSAQKVH
jgi:N-methylhydantoinase A/oxoprolinase/acetone carboxylase beta subunit